MGRNVAVLAMTLVGKEYRDRCATHQQAGDCALPREGRDGRVLVGGRIAAGDQVAFMVEPVSEQQAS